MPARSSSFRWLAAFVLSAAAAWAQPPGGTPPSGRPQPDAPPASASGVVNNSVTSGPVERAHVMLRLFANGDQQSYGTFTDADGKFTLAQIPAGQYSIVVEKAGFVTPTGIGAPMNNVNLKPGDKTENLKLKLTPDGAIYGRVLDPEGEPVEGCQVSVQSTSMNRNSGTTDEKGRFRIGGLAPDKYTVLATLNDLPFPPETRTDGTTDTHLARTYFPGVLDLKSAQRVQVAPGAEVTGIDIHLIAAPIVQVSGKVTDIPPGSQVAVQVVTPQPNGGSMSNQTPVKADGTFQIWRMDPGKYSLIAVVQQSGMSRTQSAPFEIDVGSANIEHIELRLIAPFDLTGQIAYDDAKARYQPDPKMPPGRGVATRRLMFRGDSSTGFSGPAPNPAELADDDSFTVERVTAGRYHLSVTWGAYVKSVRVGNQETEGDILDVHNGAAGAISITLSSVTAQVSGTVSDSSGPVPGAHVGLINDVQHSLQRAVADANGNYKIGNLRPGKYRILAADDDTLSAAMRATDDEKIETIEIHAGDNLTKNLTKQ